MSRPELESALEARCVAKIEAQGGLALKLAIPGVRGFPDRTVLMGRPEDPTPIPPGQWRDVTGLRPTVWFFETKRLKSGRVSAQQELWAKKLRALGHRVYFIDTDEQFDAALLKEMTR